MSFFLIAYDLIGSDESSADYRRLIEHIEDRYTNVKVLYSTFIVSTDLTHVDVRDDVADYVDDDDRLFVAQLSGASAWHNIICPDDALKAFLR